MNDVVNRPIVLIGGGGHASVLADILLGQQRKILAVISLDDISQRRVFSGIDHFRQNEDVCQFDSHTVLLVNGVGMLPKSGLKRKLNEYFLALGYQFETVIANDATISPYAKILSGAQVLPGAVIQAGVVIGEHSVINSGAIIEHDSQVGIYNHVAPRATLCGQVMTESGVYVGAGATIIQNVKLAQGCVVGAGATLTQSMPTGCIAYPARTVIKQIE